MTVPQHCALDPKFLEYFTKTGYQVAFAVRLCDMLKCKTQHQLLKKKNYVSRNTKCLFIFCLSGLGFHFALVL